MLCLRGKFSRKAGRRGGASTDFGLVSHGARLCCRGFDLIQDNALILFGNVLIG